MRKRTLWVRTVINGESPEAIVRQLASLLVLLFVFTSFSGCIGGSDASWGDDYEVTVNQDGTEVAIINTLSSSTSNHLDGEDVGLPIGQMGNSEVGHLNIGAGRIVYQDLAKINRACEDGSFENMKPLKDTFNYVKEKNKRLHFIGLVSDGGIHSHQKHLYKLCELAKKNNINQVFIHAFTDGRDCDPRSGKYYIKQLEGSLYGAQIASVCGRYYAMDRDKRWNRIKLAYDMMVKGVGKKTKNIQESIQESYDISITDEFIEPIIHIDDNDKPIGNIRDGDAVICFNFRTDRCREITMALTQSDICLLYTSDAADE